MYLLRLFSIRDPGRQIDSRRLDEGDLDIGRAPDSGWAVSDPDRAISRSHLRVTLRGSTVSVTDTSANGVFKLPGEERLTRGEPMRLAPGESVRMGGFTLLLERAEAAAPAPPPADPFAFSRPDPFAAGGPDPFAPPRSGSSPFEPIGGLDPRDDVRAKVDPFASELPRDPLAGFGGRASAPLEDAWDQRPERRVGDWDAPSPRREGHEKLIGAAREWSEPPRAPAAEVGFGFDAPFSRPLMSPAPVTADDLAIPSDWDAPERPEPPRPPARPPQAPVRAPDPPPAPTTPPPPPEPPPRPPEPEPILAPPPPPPPPEPIVPPPPPPLPEPFLAPAPPPAPEPILAPPRPSAPEPVLAPLPPPPPAPQPAPEAAPAPVRPAPPTPRQPSVGDAGLLEAFCRGAKLDPASLAGAEADAFERLGVTYRQMVLGLSDLMGERTSLKNEYRMVRTTVRREDNNPLKWSPPQRVAVELLRPPEEGFMAGPEAVNDAFMDMKKHLVCMLAGLRAALGSTLDALSPEQITSGAKDASFMQNKDALAWKEYERLYAEFRKQADDNADSPLNRAFRAAYEKQLLALDGRGPA